MGTGAHGPCSAEMLGWVTAIDFVAVWELGPVHRLLKLRTDGGYARVRERFCNVTDDRCIEPIHSTLRTSNLAGVFPGTVWT